MDNEFLICVICSAELDLDYEKRFGLCDACLDRITTMVRSGMFMFNTGAE